MTGIKIIKAFPFVSVPAFLARMRSSAKDTFCFIQFTNQKAPEAGR